MRSELRKYYSRSVKVFVERETRGFSVNRIILAGCALDPLSLAFKTGLPRDVSGWDGIANTLR